MTFRFERREKVERLFNKSKIVTIEDLKSVLSTNFSKTVFRYLKEIGYLSSYNYAGKFYTIHQVAKFDEYGLWHHETASFSKFGSLKSTLYVMITGTHDGYTHWELKQLLRCRVQNTLNELIKNNSISRELVNGLFVYANAEMEKAEIQIARRKEKSGIKRIQGKAIELPIIVEILLELLRSSAPIWDGKSISKKLRLRKISATEQQVNEVMCHYDLKKKL